MPGWPAVAPPPPLAPKRAAPGPGRAGRAAGPPPRPPAAPPPPARPSCSGRRGARRGPAGERRRRWQRPPASPGAAPGPGRASPPCRPRRRLSGRCLGDGVATATASPRPWPPRPVAALARAGGRRRRHRRDRAGNRGPCRDRGRRRNHGHGAATPAALPRSPRAARRPAGTAGGPHRRPAALPGHRCDRQSRFSRDPRDPPSCPSPLGGVSEGPPSFLRPLTAPLGSASPPFGGCGVLSRIGAPLGRGAIRGWPHHPSSRETQHPDPRGGGPRNPRGLCVGGLGPSRPPRSLAPMAGGPHSSAGETPPPKTCRLRLRTGDGSTRLRAEVRLLTRSCLLINEKPAGISLGSSLLARREPSLLAAALTLGPVPHSANLPLAHPPSPVRYFI